MTHPVACSDHFSNPLPSAHQLLWGIEPGSWSWHEARHTPESIITQHGCRLPSIGPFPFPEGPLAEAFLVTPRVPSTSSRPLQSESTEYFVTTNSYLSQVALEAAGRALSRKRGTWASPDFATDLLFGLMRKHLQGGLAGCLLPVCFTNSTGEMGRVTRAQPCA